MKTRLKIPKLCKCSRSARRQQISKGNVRNDHSRLLLAFFFLLKPVSNQFSHATVVMNPGCDFYGGPKVSRQFQLHHGNFNLTTAISTSLTAISIWSRQFQLHSRQFQFGHGNLNFTHGNFNLVTAISTSLTAISI